MSFESISCNLPLPTAAAPTPNLKLFLPMKEKPHDSFGGWRFALPTVLHHLSFFPAILCWVCHIHCFYAGIPCQHVDCFHSADYYYSTLWLPNGCYHCQHRLPLAHHCSPQLDTMPHKCYDNYLSAKHSPNPTTTPIQFHFNTPSHPTRKSPHSHSQQNTCQHNFHQPPLAHCCMHHLVIC